MAIITIAKNLKVENPVGFININPLPSGLPSGLVRAHLTRRNISSVRVNLVNNEITELNENIVSPGGAVGYEETYITTNVRRAGWTDSEFNLSYDSGFTMMAVGTAENTDNGVPTYMSTGEYQTSNGFGDRLDLDIASGQPRARYRSLTEEALGSADALAQGETGGTSNDTFYAIFGGINPSQDEVFSYLPHDSILASQDAGGVGWTPQSPSGLSLSASFVSDSAAEANQSENTKQAFAAVWDRPLSQSEMQQAYQALKPWLSRLGVDIA